MQPGIQYAKVDGAAVAYQVVGSGPPDVGL
jgi:hypothetical protein